jgi:hypothetical protein
MSEFDRRWQAGVRRARQMAPVLTPIPAGFVARVLSRRAAMEHSEGANAGIDVWIRLATRALAGAFAILMVMVALEWRDTKSTTIGFPHVEHSVAQAFWIL